ncbi:hypothetical protein EJ377_15735 [Chryseobacterium arthrosphaerae]|uniref:Thiosulphate:quinone oxidoreductase small subunit DoxA domain-containing protein n=1 Tax=Chryseobacterium arthrosphaerae TaxID=651561 RepID=A0A432DUR2_9FLAO|nr:hypothetical protein EJ377_15735 [Chryseobacterium arthrosphaerae]
MRDLQNGRCRCYGSFLIGIHILDKNGNILKEMDHQSFQISEDHIQNHYVPK